MDHSSNRGRLDFHFLRMQKVERVAAAAAPVDGSNLQSKQSSSSCSDLYIHSVDLEPNSVPAQQHMSWTRPQAVDLSCQQECQEQPEQLSSHDNEMQLASGAVSSGTGVILLQPTSQPNALPGALQCSDSQLQPDQQGCVDLDEVDVKEQERLLAQIEQVQRMKRARELLAAAKTAKRKRNRMSSR